MKKAIFLILLVILPIVLAQRSNPGTGIGQTNPGDAAVTDRTCLVDAVMKREDSLLNTWTKFSTIVETAYKTRKDELKAAWNLEDAKTRKLEVKKVWLKFKNTVKAARKLMQSERRAVWKTFRSDVQACKKKGVPVEYLETEGDDNA